MEKCLTGERERESAREGESERESDKIWNNSIGIFHVYAL